LLALVTSALAKAPQERPTAAALAGRCTELLAAQSTHVLGAEPPTLAGDVMTAAWADLPPVADDPAWDAARRKAGRRRTWLVAAAAVTGFAVAAVGTYLTVEQGRNGQTASPSKAADTPKGRKAKAPAPSATCLPVTYKTPGGQAGCESKKAICTAGSASYVKDINRLCGGPPALRTVNVISQPSTGGDPSSVYCLAWTGSASAGSRDAVLLMNAPGYQCGADLGSASGAQGVRGGYPVVFFDTEQDCTPVYPGTRLTYPAVLDYGTLGDEQPRQYACLTEHVGA
ncbi:hypothetical protein GT028_17650, partial [Streptomyces sp. SID2999]|nr:hypothetical protein [Streptomyces sp. SID2999]